ncbi:MAG: hypothetical protein KDJ52_27245 [Anaerolineae bacterium]|nr:hypothetical protein [Anaerolineae bacterium]
MIRQLTDLALIILAMVTLTGVVLIAPTPASAEGATKISGTALDGTDMCDYETDGVDEPTIFPLYFPEDEGVYGCLYSYAESVDESPSGTIREKGHEIFVSHDPDNPGTFESTYLFTLKLDENGNELWGRCQHPIIAGTGTGVYEGVTGRIDIKDDLEAGNFPYKGHLQW